MGASRNGDADTAGRLALTGEAAGAALRARPRLRRLAAPRLVAGRGVFTVRLWTFAFTEEARELNLRNHRRRKGRAECLRFRKVSIPRRIPLNLWGSFSVHVVAQGLSYSHSRAMFCVVEFCQLS